MVIQDIVVPGFPATVDTVDQEFLVIQDTVVPGFPDIVAIVDQEFLVTQDIAEFLGILAIPEFLAIAVTVDLLGILAIPEFQAIAVTVAQVLVVIQATVVSPVILVLVFLAIAGIQVPESVAIPDIVALVFRGILAIVVLVFQDTLVTPAFQDTPAIVDLQATVATLVRVFRVTVATVAPG